MIKKKKKKEIKIGARGIMALMAFKVLIKLCVIVLVNTYADKESCFHYEILSVMLNASLLYKQRQEKVMVMPQY